MDTMYYAGIGSRKTPEAVLEYMSRAAQRLAQCGFVLRSGAADGADSAFESGCDAVQGSKDIWLPWKGFNKHPDTGLYPTAQHSAVAATLHPAWGLLSRGPRALHARNVGQVLGSSLSTPVEFVLCWTPDGCESEKTRTRDTGGTGTAIVLASRLGIPVFNLKNEDARARFEQHVLGLRRRFHADNTVPDASTDWVWVFGSNLAGRHGKGAALIARLQFGATPGLGRGRMGQSYGIPTKNNDLTVRSLEEITQDVESFISYARHNPDTSFFVTRVGAGLAGYADEVMAPLFGKAPANCSLPEPWKPWVGISRVSVDPKLLVISAPEPASSNAASGEDGVIPGINIYSGAKGLGGALTNMSERAREKGKIRHAYPVEVNGKVYADAEAAYQAMKIAGEDAYNDGLMIDLISLKFRQNPKLLRLVRENGGVPWLGRCSHFTGAVTAKAKSWEGEGISSRFIRNLMHGYQKALSGEGPVTRVVHVRHAPFDVYIGRQNGSLPESIWHNPFKLGTDGTRDEVVAKFATYLQSKPELIAQVGALKGKTLGCWCKSHQEPHALCHGDVLTAAAEGHAWAPPERAQKSLF